MPVLRCAMLLAAAASAAAAPPPTPAPTPAPVQLYKCFRESGCTRVAAGTPGAEPLGSCEDNFRSGCKLPPVTPAPPATPRPTAAPVYGCDAAAWSCGPVAPGTAGAASLPVCEARCRPTLAPTPQPPTPRPPAPTPAPGTAVPATPQPPTPAPRTPAPAPTPQPAPTPRPTVAPVFGCNATAWRCGAVAAGTPGAASLPVCEARCRATPAPTPAPPRNCTALVDLLLVLDGSGSIDAPSWAIDRAAAAAIAGAFPFSCAAGFDMGIVQFSRRVVTEAPLGCDKAAFDAALGGMAQLRNLTYTGDALAAANAEFAARGRAGATQVIVLVTDGVPCTYESRATCDRVTGAVPDPAQAAKAEGAAAAFRAQGGTLVSVAVGDFGAAGLALIDALSSAPASRYVFNPATWQKLPALVGDILDSICPPELARPQ